MPEYDFEKLLIKNHVHAGILFPRQAWKETGGYPETMREGREDWAMKCRHFLALAISFLLAGCAVGPNFKRPQVAVPDQWTTALEDYVKNEAVFKCPNDPSDAKSSYGMNVGLTTKPASAIEDPARMVAIYETAHPGDCPRGGKDDLILPGRHMGGNNFGFVDGHAKWMPSEQILFGTLGENPSLEGVSTCGVFRNQVQ